MRNLKRGIAAVLAVVCLTVFSVSAVFAATSPVEGKTTVTKANGVYTIAKPSVKAVPYTHADKKTSKVYKVASSVAKNGKTYQVDSIAAKAFSGCKKLKYVKVYSKNVKTVSAKAFKGLKKSQLNKVKVHITKKMSKAQFKKLKKAFKKAGIPAKNITVSKKW